MPYINGNPVKYTHIRIKNRDHFIRSLSAVVDDKMNEYLNNFTTQATQAFANGLKNRLLRNAEPKDENSQRLVQNIADSIRAEILGHRSYIKVPIDDQNLALYLEYGTGLAGFENPHQETLVGRGKKRRYHRVEIATKGSLPWQYASNYAISYKEMHNPQGKEKGLGFFFAKDTDTYIDANDVNPTWIQVMRKERVVRKRTKPYGPDSLGRMYKHGRTYTAKRKAKTYNYYYDNWVWSRGIKPVRYVYDTKKAFAMALSEYGTGGGQEYSLRLPDKARKIIEGK